MKRIEFVTQDDSLYILPFFSEFFQSYSGEFEITRVSCCRTMGSRPRVKLLKELLLLYQPIGAMRIAGRLAAAKALSLYPVRRGASRYWSMRQLCRTYGVPFHRIGSPNDESYVQELKERTPDLLISVACPYILKQKVLTAPPMGCINIHHAPLPRYQGMMPTFWQLFHGERQVGVTVHFMTEKIDEGQVLLQEDLTVQPGESLDHLIRRSKQHGAHCLARVIRDLGAQHQHVITPRANDGSYFTFPNPDQIREFHRKGLRAI